MSKIVSFIGFFMITFLCNGQNLKIGNPMPDLTFSKVINSKNSTITLKSLKGKNVILYTWAVYCKPCIEKFPELNQLRDAHKEDLEIIMLSSDEYERIRRIFDRQQKLGKNITLPQVVLSKEEKETLSLSKEDGFGGSIWIDKEGVYRGAANIDEKNISHFIMYGEPETLNFINYANVVIDFEPVSQEKRNKNFKELMGYDPKRPLLLAKENTSIRSGSIFTGYNPNYPDKSPLIVVMKEGKPIGLRIVNALHTLLYWYPNSLSFELDSATGILTTKDVRLVKRKFSDAKSKELFNVTRFNSDSNLVANGICYELILPENATKSIPNLFQYMREDLDRYFGFSSTIETKKCLALVKSKDYEFKSKSEKTITERDNYGVSIKNGSLDFLTSAIYYYLDNTTKDEFAYIIDNTSINYPVDLEITADMKDLQSVQKALQNIGLDLVETESIREVCVVRDTNHTAP